MNDPDMRLALSVEEVARASGLSRAKVYDLVSEGRIPARRLDRRTLILADDARAWLASLPFVADCQG